MSRRIHMLFAGTNGGKDQARRFADSLNDATRHLGHLGAEAVVVEDWNAEDRARGKGAASRLSHYRVVWTPVEGLTPMFPPDMSERARRFAG